VSIVVHVILSNRKQRFFDVPDSTAAQQDTNIVHRTWDAFKTSRGFFAAEWLETLDRTLVRKAQIVEASLLTI
jgi:hypothetical protein